MKIVSFVQVNYSQGPTQCNSYYLPYSVGCLWSYANDFESIQQQYQLGAVIWRRDDVESVAQQLKSSSVVGFSSYVWNRNYNLKLAQRVRELNPTCFICFGGPEPAVADPNIFAKHPFIDAVIVREGELVFKDLLENLDNLASVAGIVYNDSGKAVTTAEPQRINDLSALPSPYLTGFFDQIMAANPDIVEWTATLETNRGCPYACTFCDWGSLTYNKVRKFSLERVYAELEWIAQKRCTFVAFTDANFGMFVERDNMIIDKYLEVQAEYGYPWSFSTSYAKNQKVAVLDMVTRLIKHSKNPNMGLKTSVQTLTEPVLDIIKRRNLDNSDLHRIFSLAEQRGVPVGTELIFGLPGETLDTWKKNYWNLFEMNLHSGIDVFFCSVLENAEMNTVQKSMYNIQTRAIHDYIDASRPNNDDVAEHIDVIVAHDTMSHEDLIAGSVFNWFVMTMHQHGITTYVARFLRRYKNISYSDFYQSLWEFLSQDPWWQNELNEYQTALHGWFEHGRIHNFTVEGVGVHGWNLNFKTVMRLHANEDLKYRLLDVVDQFTRHYNLSEEVHRDLMLLQSYNTVSYSNRDQYPVRQHFTHNIYEYITNSTATLEAVEETVEFDFRERRDMVLQEFLERLYFTRLRHFGSTWTTKI